MSVTYTKSKILSNSEFHYKDGQQSLPKDQLIPFTHEFEKKLEIPHNLPTNHIKKASSVKQIFVETPNNAFELAEEEEQKTEIHLRMKKMQNEQRSKIIQDICDEKNKEIKE